MDGQTHEVKKWDLIIAHPPCTYISNAGACRLYPKKGELDKDRYIKGLNGKAFFMMFYWYGFFNVGKIVIENPLPSRIYGLPNPTNVIQPYEYGDGYSKRTFLWEFGVPPLMPHYIGEGYKTWLPSATHKNRGTSKNKGTNHSARMRSKTFQGIAEAMAEQWGGSA